METIDGLMGVRGPLIMNMKPNTQLTSNQTHLLMFRKNLGFISDTPAIIEVVTKLSFVVMFPMFLVIIGKLCIHKYTH